MRGVYAPRREERERGKRLLEARPQSASESRCSGRARDVPKWRLLKARGEGGVRGMGETERVRPCTGRAIGESDPRSRKELEDVEDIEEVEPPRR